MEFSKRNDQCTFCSVRSSDNNTNFTFTFVMKFYRAFYEFTLLRNKFTRNGCRLKMSSPYLTTHRGNDSNVRFKKGFKFHLVSKANNKSVARIHGRAEAFLVIYFRFVSYFI